MSIAQNRERRNVIRRNYNETVFYQNDMSDDSDSFQGFAPEVRHNERRSTSKPVKYNEMRVSDDSGSEDCNSYIKFNDEEHFGGDSDEEINYESSDDGKIERIIGIKKDSSEILYYVKFQNQSYKHCEFLTLEQIFEFPNGEHALKRFELPDDISEMSSSSSIANLLLFNDEDDVKPNWLKVDRIIDDALDEDDQEQLYLVKWQSQEYEEATWETEEDISDPAAIEAYRIRKTHWNSTNAPIRYIPPDPTKFAKIEQTPKSIDGNYELREYQLYGLNWLRFCWFNSINSILADQMGLGKTAQISCLLEDLRANHNITGPFLVVAPVSTLPQWKIELERWTHLNVVIYHGTSTSKEIIRETEIEVKDEHDRLIKNRVRFDVLITNYETIINENQLFEIYWRYIIVDEAHRLKNYNSKLYQFLIPIECEHTTLLTGTPLQNNTEELWSLLHFLDQDKFNDLTDFLERFGDLHDADQVKGIRELIQPYILRRKKSDVEKDLAPKEETVIEVELTQIQKEYYKILLSNNAAPLLKQINSRSVPSLVNIMMQLRKVCNHPFLIKGAEKAILESNGNDRNEALIESSGKMVLINKLLPKLKADGHKVLIFSQMTKILDLLQSYLISHDYRYERLDGGCSELDRAAGIERFNSLPDDFVFLLSTKAGGVGINLASADTVIIYDSDWNPQNDIQAQDRCHRIGQHKTVKVYRLITRNTYESEMYKRASKKLALDHVVLNGNSIEDEDPKELEKILSNGIRSIINDSDTEIEQFKREDIDQILSRRTKVYTQDIIAGGDSIFAKAKFDAEKDDETGQAFWKQILESIGHEEEEEPTQRRCRVKAEEAKKQQEELKSKKLENQKSKKLENQKSRKQKSMGNEKKMLKSKDNVKVVIQMMRQWLPLDAQLLTYLQYAYVINDNKKQSKNKDVCKALLEDHGILVKINKSKISKLESQLGSASKKIQQNSDLILEKVGYFHRLAVVLAFLQQPGFSWPNLSPWGTPLDDYGLLLHTLYFGIKIPSQITEDDFEYLQKAPNVTRPTIERRLDKMISQFEEQLPSDFKPELKTFLQPQDWIQKFPDILSRKVITIEELLSIVHTVQIFGIPLITKDEIGSREKKKIKKRTFKKLKNSEEIMKNEKIIDTNRIMKISHLSYINNQTLVDIVHSIKKFAETGTIDESLKEIKDELNDEVQKSLKNSIETYGKIHEFFSCHSLTDNEEVQQFTEKLEKVGIIAQQPVWWTPQHSIAFLRCMENLGYKTWKDMKKIENIFDDSENKLKDMVLIRENLRAKFAEEIICILESPIKDFPIKIDDDFTIVGIEPHYVAKRIFWSYKEANQKIIYTMEKYSDKFVIKAEKNTFEGKDPMEAWGKVKVEMDKVDPKIGRLIEPIVLSGITHPSVSKLQIL